MIDPDRLREGRTVRPLIDVVIPVHNCVHWAEVSLREIFRFRSTRMGRVVVVDDRSEPAQAEQLNRIVARYPEVIKLTNTDDVGGFGTSCNFGSRACENNYILFLNSDCLVTDGTVDKMAESLDSSPDIVLASPISNNSPELTYSIWPGRSFRDMSRIFAAAAPPDIASSVLEACTIVGNCLAVKSDFFEREGGFSPDWKDGYGEETDLQMRAIARGLRGVANISSYVYHFGNGTFDYLEHSAALRAANYKLFMKRWKKEYYQLKLRESSNPVLASIDARLREYISVNREFDTIDLDVLFYLPGIKQDIGGLNFVVQLCNSLILSGIRACCALVGPIAMEGRESYKEPVYFNFLTYSSDYALLNDRSVRTKTIVSTIWASAQVVSEFAAARGSVAIQFVQGYECYFENGIHYPDVIKWYAETPTIFTTSKWLHDQIERHLTAEQTLVRLPLPLNPDVFFSYAGKRSIDVLFTLRSAPDKGQWMVMELLGRLARESITIAVIAAPAYVEAVRKTDRNIRIFESPLKQYTLARLFRDAKVFVDLSHHEGFGLMAAEAASCGCRVVSSDSGGTRDLCTDFQITLLPLSADPRVILDAVRIEVNKSADLPQSIAAASRYQEDILVWKEELERLGEKADLVDVSHWRRSVERSVDAIGFASSLKQQLVGWGAKLYLRLRPYLPRRIVVALKVLILGHV